MTRLTELYRPQRLADVILSHVTDDQGETAGDYLLGFAAKPHSKCMAFVGPPGTGKTTTALALVRELGAHKGWPGMHYVNASEVKVDELPAAYRWLECGICCPQKHHWHVLVLEELSTVSPQAQQWLKSAFEACLPPRAVVIATSNDLSKLQRTVVQRFVILNFPDSLTFRNECARRASWIFHELVTQPYGVEAPDEDTLIRWGTDVCSEFSYRTLLDRIEMHATKAAHNRKVKAGWRPSAAELKF